MPRILQIFNPTNDISSAKISGVEFPPPPSISLVSKPQVLAERSESRLVLFIFEASVSEPYNRIRRFHFVFTFNAISNFYTIFLHRCFAPAFCCLRGATNWSPCVAPIDTRFQHGGAEQSLSKKHQNMEF